MWKVNNPFYYLSAFIVVLFTGCMNDSPKEKPDKDSLEQQKREDTLKIDEPMQACLGVNDF